MHTFIKLATLLPHTNWLVTSTRMQVHNVCMYNTSCAKCHVRGPLLSTLLLMQCNTRSVLCYWSVFSRHRDYSAHSILPYDMPSKIGTKTTLTTSPTRKAITATSVADGFVRNPHLRSLSCCLRPRQDACRSASDRPRHPVLRLRPGTRCRLRV